MNLNAGVALSAGMLAAINPCGFALLPAYLAYFVGTDDLQPRGAAWRGVKIALAMSLGFVTVFGLLGTILSFALSWFRTPNISIALGVLMIIVGILMLAGRQPSFALPHYEPEAAARSFPGAALFGVSYAVASLSCTLPVFSSVVIATGATDQHWVTRIIHILLYALGTTSVITILTVAVATARSSIVKRIRSVMPHMTRIAGVLVVVAGAFVTYYGWWEREVLKGNIDTDSLAASAQRLQTEINRNIDRIGVAPILIVSAFIVCLAILGASRHPKENT